MEPVQLSEGGLAAYRGELARYERQRLQTGEADGRKLWVKLEAAVITHIPKTILIRMRMLVNSRMPRCRPPGRPTGASSESS